MGFRGQFAQQQFCTAHVRFGSIADIGCARAMSALPPKADIGTQLWNVRFVPKADIGYSSINRAVGAEQSERRNREAQRIRSL